MSVPYGEQKRADSAPLIVGGDGITTNPFSTRHIRPGAIPYIFRDGDSATPLVALLQANHWWGQIIGPHGTGKSTLLAELMPRLAITGRQPLLIELHDGERSLAAHRELLAQAHADTIVIIDGYEQLSCWHKWRLRLHCRRRGAGLLVTAHASAGLPQIAETAVDAETAQAVLARLVSHPAAEDQAALTRALAAHGGNLREALFDLYDLYESRRRNGG